MKLPPTLKYILVFLIEKRLVVYLEKKKINYRDSDSHMSKGEEEKKKKRLFNQEDLIRSKMAKRS